MDLYLLVCTGIFVVTMIEFDVVRAPLISKVFFAALMSFIPVVNLLWFLYLLTSIY